MNKMNKLLRKSIALTGAITMLLSSVCVANAETATEMPTTDVESGGEAGVHYYENDIVSLDLPTAAVFETPFVIDPQGVLSVTSANGDIDTAKAGKVVPASVAKIQNASGFPVNVVTSLYVTKDLSTGEASSVDWVTANTGLATSEDNEIFLNVYHTKTAGITTAEYTALAANVGKTEIFDDANLEATPINVQANGKTKAMEVTFALKEAAYNLTMKTAASGDTPAEYGWVIDPDITDNYSLGAFFFGGEVAQKADWSGYGSEEGQEKIALKAVFKIEEAASTPATKLAVTSQVAVAPTFFKNVATSYNESDITETTTAVSLKTPYTVDPDTETNLAIPVDFGKAGQKANITYIGLAMGDGEAITLVEGTDYKVTATGLELLDSSANLWSLDYATANNAMYIGTADAAGNEVWLTVTYATQAANP